jgi:hypothetical protein
MPRRAKEPIPQHRRDAMTWSSEAEARRRLIRIYFCGECQKLSLRTQTEARSYIGLLLLRQRQHDYVMKPYRCPHGNGWHAGHDYAAIRILKRGKR